MSGEDLLEAAYRGDLPEAERILERNPNLLNYKVRAAGCPCPARPPAHGAVGPPRGRSAGRRLSRPTRRAAKRHRTGLAAPRS